MSALLFEKSGTKLFRSIYTQQDVSEPEAKARVGCDPRQIIKNGVETDEKASKGAFSADLDLNSNLKFV